MCIIFIIAGQHPDYPLIIAANRDEHYARPTVSANFWPNNNILAGKDLLAGGTWLGVSRQGRFAAVTNYRQPTQSLSTLSRGLIVSNFLESSASPEQYADILYKSRQAYTGYNCLFGTLAPNNINLHYFSNQAEQALTLKQGIYGLSNALLDTPWPKVTLGKTSIPSLLQKPFHIDDWMMLLRNKAHAEFAELPDTGIGIKNEHLLSPVFIQGDNYGTRSSTIITVAKSGILSFFEQTYSATGIDTPIRQFSFEITP